MVFLVDGGGFGRIHVLECGDGDYRLMHYAANLQRLHQVLYVDCANSFDPYFVYRRAGKRGEALERIHVCRPFTLYQLRSLVGERLEDKIQESGGQSLLIPCINGYGLDHSFDKKEYEVVTEEIMDGIESLTRDYQLFTLITMEA